MQNTATDEYLEQRLVTAKKLVAALEEDNSQQADQLTSELAMLQESAMYQEIGKLTRQLHDTMRNFSLDVKITGFAENEIPDARERLQYVMAMTEQAANTTLNQVEGLTPISMQLNEQSSVLKVKWEQLLSKKLSYPEFKAFSKEIQDYLETVSAETSTLNHGLNEILMAQGFQDVTGQIIRKVIELVREIETSMVELIKISGCRKNPKYEEINEKQQQDGVPLEGPIVPGVNDNDSVGTQDEVDDLLSSLGF